MTDDAPEIDTDFGDDAPPDPAKIAEVLRLAGVQRDYLARIAAIEGELALLQKGLKDNVETKLPYAMREAGLPELGIGDGLRVELKETILAGLTEATFPAAKAWLEERGFDDIIKRNVTFELGKGAGESAERLIEFARALPVANSMTIKNKEFIAPQTLGKFVRDGLEIGMPIPEETFGVFRRRAAEVVAVKKRRKKDEI
jgi:hypothetical protein